MAETNQSQPVVSEYWCFISYRHKDNNTENDRAWATWLHQEIERYEVPAELVGTENERGHTLPERIYPVFRDEVSLSADADLASSIVNALDRSRFLVCLCSPNAVKSTYVAQEIQHFKQSGKRDRVIAAILSGEPGHAEKECFPEPLRHPVADDGVIDNSVTEEPIAADFRLRDGTEGFTSSEAYRFQLARQGTLSRREIKKRADVYEGQLQLMKLKIIAGILAVPLETLRNRDQAYRLEVANRKATVLRRWLLLVTLLAIAVIAGGIFAVNRSLVAEERRKTSNHARGQAEDLIEFMLFELRDQLQPMGRLDLLGGVATQAEKYFSGLPEDLREDRDTRRNQAALLGNSVTIHLASGDLKAAENASRSMLKISNSLKVDELEETDLTERVDRLHSLMVSHDKLGDALRNQEHSEKAAGHYEEALGLVRQILSINPGPTEWLGRQGGVLQKLGVLYLGTDYPRAKAYLEESLDIFRELQRSEPSETRWSRSVAACESALGDWHLLQGDPVTALPRYSESKRVLEEILANTKDSNLAFELGISRMKQGDCQRDTEKPQEALASYDSAMKTLEELYHQDPDNAEWHRSYAIILQRIGDISVTAGIPESREMLEKAVATFQRLATKSPGNTTWLQDLAVSHRKLGNYFLEKELYDDAFKQLSAIQSLLTALTFERPDESQFWVDLGGNSLKLGDIAYRRFRMPKNALEVYDGALAAYSQLNTMEPENPLWLHQLWIVHQKMGEAAEEVGMNSPEKARQHFRQALAFALKRGELTEETGIAEAENHAVLSYIRLALLERKYRVTGWEKRFREGFESALDIIKRQEKEERLEDENRKWRGLIEAALVDTTGR